MRIREHPILRFPAGGKISFFFDGREVEAFEGDTVAGALTAAGLRILAHSRRLGRPRGLFCAIGNCASCLMEVDGQPNVRVCVEKVRPGMQVCSQAGKGRLL
ncbi:MAG: (2Fe-2S)-binding protein [Clostridiales bacterium]|nr:(2Fe-2S)-binding protein [Clostridiales bacterium]